MESFAPANKGAASAGAARASRLRTRLQSKVQQAKEHERDIQSNGLTEDEYWTKYVNGKEDIERFFKIYRPDYPEILAKAIAMRISEIIDKSRRGETLTEEEKMYVVRSKQPKPHWDPMEEIKQHEMAAKVQNAVKRLSEL